MTKMAWLPTYTYLLAALLLLAPTLAAVCPDSCVCSTTRDGLHRVTCSNLAKLYKYTLRQKNHMINILDLSHNNITKISHELDKLTEIVTLDLSANGLTTLNKFLHSSKKLVHLNLAHNRLQKLSLTNLPVSISSLDVTGNLLKDVPSDLGHLQSLEHLLLEGNPLNCSCRNIISRNRLLASKVFIDNVKCQSPDNLKGRSWLELKTTEICKSSKIDFKDIILEDQPLNAIRIAEETSALKSKYSLKSNELEDGEIIHNTDSIDDDDTLQFVRVKRFPASSTMEDISEKNDKELQSIITDLVNGDPDEDLIGEGSGFFSSLDTDFKEDKIEVTSHKADDVVGDLSKITTEGSKDQIESDITTSKAIEVNTDVTDIKPILSSQGSPEIITDEIASKVNRDDIESALDITAFKNEVVDTELKHVTPIFESDILTESIPEITTSKSDEIKSEIDEISNSNDKTENDKTKSTPAIEKGTNLIDITHVLRSENSTDNILDITSPNINEEKTEFDDTSKFGDEFENSLDTTTSKADLVDAELNNSTVLSSSNGELSSESEKIPTDKFTSITTELNNIFHSNEQIDSVLETTTPTVINESVDGMLSAEELFAANNNNTTDEDIEGSGDGSGYYGFEHHKIIISETTTPVIQDLSPDPVHKIFVDREENNEFPTPDPPSVYQGGPNWNSKTGHDVVPTVSVSPELTKDTTVSEQIRVTQASEVLGQAPPGDENVVPHKTGTYVCIALIIVLLVGLIGFAITKGQMRKRRDRRLLRQQKRDVEKASKEMVDMNKSLLGKPAVVENSDEKRVNGKYELVPTHESHQKKEGNGDVANGFKHDNEEVRTDSPRDTNQNKSSSIDNNLSHQNPTQQQETSIDSGPGLTNSRKDTNSLSSEDIFVPINDDDNPRLSSNIDLDVSQPMINGDPIVDADYLSPSREYVPVYSPDMGRVRIKMTETPKPKTPVLVTRSRSNAGDIIITPTLDGNASKSTT